MSGLLKYYCISYKYYVFTLLCVQLKLSFNWVLVFSFIFKSFWFYLKRITVYWIWNKAGFNYWASGYSSFFYSYNKSTQLLAHFNRCTVWWNETIPTKRYILTTPMIYKMFASHDEYRRSNVISGRKVVWHNCRPNNFKILSGLRRQLLTTEYYMFYINTCYVNCTTCNR